MSGNFDYGVIGNCRSAALVSRGGSIDWLCLPDFHDASVFAALLDAERGGRFAILPKDLVESVQEYLPRTNILRTLFRTRTGDFEVYDFMPRYEEDGEIEAHPEVIRYLRRLSGRPVFRVDYSPRLGYAEHGTETYSQGDYIKSVTLGGRYESVYLYTSFRHSDVLEARDIPLDADGFFLLNYNQKLLRIDLDRVVLKFERTKVYWMNWSEKTLRYSFATESVLRSALVLKLLTYQKTGAILAAVTTSLPELPGGPRNWDYRYCWIRDAAMIVNTFLSLGHAHTASAFLRFLFDVVPLKDEKLQIMYGIRGERELEERELGWLSGNRGSRPVRVGNAAYRQTQNDIYGVLLDVIHQYFVHFQNSLSIGEDLWTVVRSLARTVEGVWRLPDAGIWEFRNRCEHFVYSKLMSWVAMDRAARVADLLGFGGDWDHYRSVADAIRNDVFAQGYDPALGAFTQSYGSPHMDAANLLMEHYGMIEAHDPRYVGTVLRTRDELLHQGLMYRYKAEDDFGTPRTAFTICTFWMVKSLCRIGRRQEAEDLFRHTLSFANHLGLFSEGIEFDSGHLVGNFPQGYSHLALIDAAITLSGHDIERNSRVLWTLRDFA